MSIDWLFDLTPEQREKQRQHEEKQRLERQRKIERAVKEENLEFSIREYGKVTEGEKSRQTITIFIGTKMGIDDRPDTLGRIEFTIHQNASLEDVFIRAKFEGRHVHGQMENLLHFDKIGIYSEYRGYGLSEKLVSYFFDLYTKKYSQYPISVEFMNPIAEYTLRKVLKAKGMKNILNEQLIRRYYVFTENTNHKALIDLLKKKDNDLFPLDSVIYISKTVND